MRAVGVVVVMALCASAPRWLSAQRSSQDVGEQAVSHARGLDVVPVYEGWFRDEKDILHLSFGYLNRNFAEELSIPTGPDNRIEPGSADQGQPTYFVARRQWGVFTVVVPKALEQEFHAQKKSTTWTLRSKGQVTSVSANLGPNYVIDAMKDPTVDNVPPSIKWSPNGKEAFGPHGVSATLKAAPGSVPLRLWIKDDGRGAPFRKRPDITLRWSEYRGPAPVVFNNQISQLAATSAYVEANAVATFSAPGEYVLRVEAVDTATHEFQCCWTNGYLHVTVEPKPAAIR